MEKIHMRLLFYYERGGATFRGKPRKDSLYPHSFL